MNDKNLTIGIIGLGKFGTLTASILSEHFPVRIYHYKDTKEKRDLTRKIGADFVDFKTVCESDVIILTVPIFKTEDMIKQVAGNARKGALIMDTCSVKVYPCEWLKKHVPEGIDIMGTHPMFGPVTTKFDLDKKYWKLDDKQIVLCPIRISPEKLKCVKDFCSKLGLEIIETTPEDHDEQNAKTLSLVHFLGRSLTRAGIGEQKIYTPGYTDLLSIIPHTNSDKWQLFCDMNNYNPFALKVREKFIASGEALVEGIVEADSQDELEFNRNMIDMIDKKIIKLLEKRFKHASAIGEIKKEKELAITDEKREEKIISKLTSLKRLDEKFVKNLYNLIFKESKRLQNLENQK